MEAMPSATLVIDALRQRHEKYESELTSIGDDGDLVLRGVAHRIGDAGLARAHYGLARGAETDARASERVQGALFYAIKEGHVPSVQHLIEKRYAKVNARDADGRSAIRAAVRAGHASVVSYLIGMKALLADGADDEEGDPLLRRARRHGGFFFNPFELPLSAAAAAPRRRPCSLLYEAVAMCRPAVVALLVRTGAFDVNAKNGAAGETPLHRAVAASSLAIVRTLVGDARAEINVVDDARRKTPLDLAAEVSVLAPSPDAEAVLRILREETVRSVVQLAMEYKWAHLW